MFKLVGLKKLNKIYLRLNKKAALKQIILIKNDKSEAAENPLPYFRVTIINPTLLFYATFK